MRHVHGQLTGARSFGAGADRPGQPIRLGREQAIGRSVPHRYLVNRLAGTPVVAGMKKFLGTAALAATALSLAAAISLAQAGLTAVASPDVKQSDFSQLDGVAVAGADSAWAALPGTRNRIAAPRSGRSSSAEAGPPGR